MCSRTECEAASWLKLVFTFSQAVGGWGVVWLWGERRRTVSTLLVGARLVLSGRVNHEQWVKRHGPAQSLGI